MVIKVQYDVTNVYVSSSESPVYITVSYGNGITVVNWGDIDGTLSDQTDLQNALDAKVPYSGATGNVDLGEYELKAGQIELDQSPTGTAGVAVTRWNDTNGITETTLKGGNVVLKNGIDLVARVVNKVTPNTTLTKAAYQAVRVSGAQGQRLAVALAQANNDNNSADTIGLVTETIPTNQEGFIMTVGQLEGINTTGSLQGETWADGDVIYLSPTTAGALTNVKPVAPQHIIVIGYVEYAHQNNGKLYVKVMNGWELGELHDVDTTGATNGQVLAYESATGVWKPTTNGSGTVTSVGLTSATSGVTISNSPITSSGDISLAIATASGTQNGLLSSTDWTTFNNKQNALTNPITGTGTSGQVAYFTGSTTQAGSSTFLFSPTSELDLANSVTAATAIARGARIRPTLVASANNDVLVGLDIAPTFNNGAFTGVSNYGLRITNSQIRFDGTSEYDFIRINTGTTTNSYTNFILAETWGPSIFRGISFQYYNSTYTTSSFRIASSASITTGADATNGISIVARATNSPIRLWHGTTQTAQFFGNGNLLLQSGGTFTDGGQRLQVQGDVFIKGSGNTSASNALLIQNSSGTGLGYLRNDGYLYLGPSTPGLFLEIGTNDNRGISIKRTSGAQLDIWVSNASSLISSGSQVTIGHTGGTNYAAANFSGSTVTLNGAVGGSGTINLQTNSTNRLQLTNSLATISTSTTISGSTTASGAIARGVNVTSTLVAAANNDVLVGLDVNPTFTNGAFTGVSNWAARIQGRSILTYNDNSYNQGFYVQNTNTGTTSITGIILRNSSSVDVAAFSYYPSNYITSSQQNTVTFASITTQKLGFQACAAGGANAAQDIWFSNKGGQFNATLFSTGNLLIQSGGTHTDAGFRLDVNGTARVQGQLTVSTGGASITGDVAISGVLRETVTTNRQTASYTLALTDRGKLVEMNVGSANDLTIPLNSSVAFPIGTKIDIAQYGAGQTTIVATSGVTVRSANGWLKINAQYGAASLVKIGTDEWYAFGNLNA